VTGISRPGVHGNNLLKTAFLLSPGCAARQSLPTRKSSKTWNPEMVKGSSITSWTTWTGSFEGMHPLAGHYHSKGRVPRTYI
jgi:hypothetical protein